MAKYEKEFKGNFDEILTLCEKTILDNSSSASSEEQSDWSSEGIRAAVRVFERYSYVGGNRVSLNLTLIGKGDQLFLTAITAGGSQAVIFKINTWGEEAFLDTLVPVIDEYAAREF